MTGFASVIASIVTLFGGMPIAFALIAVSAVYILFEGTIPFAVIVQRLASTVGSSGFLAFPFFMLSAEIMNVGGVTRRLVRFSKALVGSLPGGLAVVVTASSMLFAAITGSAIATVAAIGTLLFPAMVEAGYNPGFAAAVVAAASVMGPIIPPSGSLIIWGITANVSVGQLLLAGWIPGILMGLSMMVLIVLMAKRKKMPAGAPFDPKELVRAAWEALPALLLPVFVLVAVYTGVCTVAESAVVAVFYALFINLFVYRELDVRGLPKLLSRAATSSAGISLIVGSGAVLSWVLTRERIPQAIVSWFASVSSSPLVMGAIVYLFLLVLGCMMDNVPAIIMLAPLLDSLGRSYGYSSVHWGFFCTYVLLLGLLTPPVGMVLFVTQDLTQVDFRDLVKEVIPFVLLFVLIGVLVLVVPEIPMVIPNLVLHRLSE